MDSNREFSPRPRASSFPTSRGGGNERGPGRPRLPEEERKRREEEATAKKAEKERIKAEKAAQKAPKISEAVGRGRPRTATGSSLRALSRLSRGPLGAAATAVGVGAGVLGTYYTYKGYQASQEQNALDESLEGQAEQHQQERAALNDQHGAQEEELRQRHETQRQSGYLPNFITEPGRQAERKDAKDRRNREEQTLRLKQEAERNELKKNFKEQAQQKGQRKSSYEAEDFLNSPF